MSFLRVFPVAKTPGIHRFLNDQIHNFACLSCSCCRLSGSLRIRFTARLLDLIRRKSVLHLNSSTFSALDLRNAILASSSATPTFVANIIELGFYLEYTILKCSYSHLNIVASVALKNCINSYILLLMMYILHSLPWAWEPIILKTALSSRLHLSNQFCTLNKEVLMANSLPLQRI